MPRGWLFLPLEQRLLVARAAGRACSVAAAAPSGCRVCDEIAGLGVGERQQLLPFVGSSRAAARTGADTASLSEANKATSSNGSGSEAIARAAAERKGLIDIGAIGADQLQGLLDQRIVGLRAGARDEVDQLPPAHRTVMRVDRRLVQHRHQAIVEPHQLKSASLQRHG